MFSILVDRVAIEHLMPVKCAVEIRDASHNLRILSYA